MAWIAWLVRRRGRTTEGYFLGSRALPGWAVGFSIAGTAISSITFMALPADAFEFLEKRFGASTRLYGAFAFVVGQLLRISLILFLLGQLTHELTGLSPEA